MPKLWSRAAVPFACAVLAAGCGGRSEAPRERVEAGAAGVTPPPPDTLLGIARRLVRAWTTGDAAAFRTDLSARFVDFKSGYRVDKEGLVAMVAGSRCQITTWDLSDPQVAMIDPNVYVLSYAGRFDGSCAGPDGVPHRMLSPTRSASIFVREGRSWAGAFHSENRIDSVALAATSPAAPARDAAIVAAESKAPAGGNTATLAQRHAAVWSALVAGDSARLADALTATVSIVSPAGGWSTGRDAVLRTWRAASSCPGATRVTVSDAVATPIAEGVELLTVRAVAAGGCGAGRGGDRFQSAVYVNDRGTWRLAFVFDSFVS